MKQYRSADGETRLWYDDDEIERVMEDELRRSKLTPTPTQTAVDIEAFIEDHLRAPLDQYADLPASVLGVTTFHPYKSPEVRINKDLTGTAMDSDWCPPGLDGRWRATLAHEAAHVVLHRILFDADLQQGALFDTTTIDADPDKRLFRCLKRDLSLRVAPDWREIQANKGMAALLMPKRIFTRAARQAGASASRGADLLAATRTLASTFGVSRQAATIRLQTLGFIQPDDAEQLFAESD